MSGELHNTLYNFGTYMNKEFRLEEQNIEAGYRYQVDKSLDIGSHARGSLSGRKP